MAYKIEIKDNAIQVLDTLDSDKVLIFQPSKDTWYEEDRLGRGFIKLYGTTSTNEDNIKRYLPHGQYERFDGFAIAECVDTDDVVFTAATFRDFSSLNLGKSSGGSASIPTILDNRIIVTQANKDTTLGGVIDSSKEYFIDGVVDMGATQITVPTTGISLRGYSFDTSGLVSSEDNYIMFVSESEVIGSGNLLGFDYYVTTSGTNSKVHDLYDATGFNAIEYSRVNFNNCTSLGDLHDYRQYLEFGTGRFGGSPSLTLHGDWLGGFRASATIVRSMSNTTTEPLFKKGIDLVMQSRFLTDINCDLGALQPLLDFDDTNFPNPSTLELRDAIITRQGVISPNDANITPNIGASNLSCSWKGNNGVNNTFVGGIATITTEIETSLTEDVPSVLLGTVTTSDLQHFDSPSNGQLRHLGSNPREYTVNFDFVLDGSSNAEYKIELVKDDGATSVVYQQTRVVNNLQGGRDVAYFTGLANLILNKDEFVYWQVTNLSNSSNCTLENDSSWSVEER